jgi:cysteine desulfurase
VVAAENTAGNTAGNTAENGALVYLDHAATTPMRRAAVEAMIPYLAHEYANPSGSHRFARRARQVIDEARDMVAEVIGCTPGEVVFTGSGTEGDNMAIRGVIERRGGRAVCSAAEHHAVLHCVEHEHGLVLPTDRWGRIDLERLDAVLAESPAEGPDAVTVVSVMAVNNETGSITDMKAVSKIVRRRAPHAVLHTDAVQAACWIDVREVWPQVDAMALSAHKFGGPKGVGVLAMRNGTPIAPLLLGGGQERDRRSGTHNVAGIVATAVAMVETDRERRVEYERVARLRERLIDGVSVVGDLYRTLPADLSVPGVAHLCFPGVENEALLYLLDEAGVCASAASACASGAMEPSHVLAAMGVERSLAHGALRLSLGHTTTEGDVDRAITAVVSAVRHVRDKAATKASGVAR